VTKTVARATNQLQPKDLGKEEDQVLELDPEAINLAVRSEQKER